MKELNYVTGNKNKFANSRTFFDGYGISLNQVEVKIYEIQSDNSLDIAKSKVEQAWNSIKKPLFVNDAYWMIPSLNGFPGPYMKYINQWFKPEDFINLMQGKKDRTIILRDTIVYKDENEVKVFTNDHTGEVLDKPYEGKFRFPSDVVISLSKSKKSVAEEVASGTTFIENENKVWIDFVEWFKNK